MYRDDILAQLRPANDLNFSAEDDEADAARLPVEISSSPSAIVRVRP